MCDICRSVPCRSRCPNAPAKAEQACDFCRSVIYAGDRSFADKHGNFFCSFDCAIEFHGIFEK